ncbi:PRELI domain-containing protein 2-like [Actinia tenebrosa]|uniref:PRELI domain-containing protein 2-like n=1 Tax=Actinia tenebrosa TaxID=6105 RepID=A0A6P8HI00_ACTTE|nr:PRELI domain-containing protein 2-like [Actinia tenebrosa]
MRCLEFHYLFKYSFETVVHAYFQKYTSGKDKNVTSVIVLEHTLDQNTGDEYIVRRGKCVNVLPSIFNKFLPFPAIEVEEKAWLSRKEKVLQLHSYNITASDYVKVEEYSTYFPSESNEKWTVMKQKGVITAFGLGPVFGKMLEAFAVRFFHHGANKGFNIMEDLLMTMHTTSNCVTEN